MFMIRRTKGGAVHFATGIDERGHITGLSRKRPDAAKLTEEEAKKCLDFYERRADERPQEAANVGELDLIEAEG
jgi:hypothetical protein